MTTLRYKNQQGAVLIVSLIMLLIMTLIGVSSMQTSTLQERMAANDKQKFLSQLAAESALKQAEDYLEAQNFTNTEQLENIFIGETGHYSLRRISATVSEFLVPNTFNVDDPTEWLDGINANSIVADTVNTAGMARAPRYIIEFLGSEEPGANNSATEIPQTARPPKPFFFRITAIGWAGDENIFTVLESSYMSTP